MPVKVKRERKSQISKHPDRVRIETARLSGVGLDKIAARYSVHRDSIWRHMLSLPDDYKAQLILDVPIRELAERAREADGSLLDHLEVARSVVVQQMLAAAACNDRYAVATLGRVSKEIGSEIGKLTGEIKRLVPGFTINNTLSIIQSPGFMALESGLLGIVQRHPEVKDDVIDLVRRLKQAPEPPLMIEGERANA